MRKKILGLAYWRAHSLKCQAQFSSPHSPLPHGEPWRAWAVGKPVVLRRWAVIGGAKGVSWGRGKGKGRLLLSGNSSLLGRWGTWSGFWSALLLGKPVFLARGSVSALPNMPINAHYAHLQRSELLVFGAVRNFGRLLGRHPHPETRPRGNFGRLRGAFSSSETPNLLAQRKLSVCNRETSCLSAAVGAVGNSSFVRFPLCPFRLLCPTKPKTHFVVFAASQISLILSLIYI